MPVAKIHICHNHKGCGYEQQGIVLILNAECALGEPHEQRYPEAEDKGSEPGVIEILREVAGYVSEEASRGNHHLLEKQRGREEEIELLDLPKQIALEPYQGYDKNQRSCQP